MNCDCNIFETKLNASTIMRHQHKTVQGDNASLMFELQIGERKIEELVAENLAMEKEMTVEKDKGKKLLDELDNLKSESARQLDNLKQVHCDCFVFTFVLRNKKYYIFTILSV